MVDSEFNCTKCKVRYPRDRKLQQAHQERKWCFSTSDKPHFAYKGVGPMGNSTAINYSQCPARFYSNKWASIIGMHDQYKKGVMPFDGSPMDQPASIIEAFNLINNLKEEAKFKHEQTMRKYGK
jgi:hypothetical protein